MNKLYHFNIYSFCENPEKAWLKIISQNNLFTPEPQTILIAGTFFFILSFKQCYK